MSGVDGTIYLLHFETPYEHARHYLGWSADHIARINRHSAGWGSPLVKAVIESGTAITLVRTWPGTRNNERSLKRAKNTPRLCPRCNERGSMMDAQEAINLLARSRTRDHAAEVYRRALALGDGDFDWSAFNSVIIDRWSMNGLKYIKAKAWSSRVA